jgi:hypothetical protein
MTSIDEKQEKCQNKRQLMDQSEMSWRNKHILSVFGVCLFCLLVGKSLAV